MEFETGRRSTLARLQLSVQGLAGSLNSAKKVLVVSTVLTAAFCGAIFGLTLVANEASKESHITDGILTSVDGSKVKTTENKSMNYLSAMSAESIAKADFVSFTQDGADRYMQILGVQSTASKKVINTIVGAFEVTEEGMTFDGDNVVLEATEADKAARKAQCKFCANGGRNTQCHMCANGGRTFAVAGRNPMCAVCVNGGRSFQCAICHNGAGRATQCKICANNGRNNQCAMCANFGRSNQCLICHNGAGRQAQCYFCTNWGGRVAQRGGPSLEQISDGGSEGEAGASCDNGGGNNGRDAYFLDDADDNGNGADNDIADGGAAPFDITQVAEDGNALQAVVDVDNANDAFDAQIDDVIVCDQDSENALCFGA